MKPVARKKQKLTLRSIIRFLLVLSVFAGFVWLATKFAQFNQSRSTLPSGVSVAGVNVGDLSVSDAVSRTANVFQQPVILRYQGETIPVTTEMVEFAINPMILRLQLDQMVEQNRGIGRFPAWLMGNISPQKLDLPFLYSDTKLKNVLSAISKQYDRPPQDAKTDPAKLSISQTRDGQMMDVSVATQQMVQAFTSISNRVVDLPVDVVSANRASTNILAELVQSRTAGFIKADVSNGVGVYIKDLQSGQEFVFNGNTSFSAQGWLKIALLVETYRQLGDAATPEIRSRLLEMITTDDKGAGDAVLTQLGKGDLGAGLAQFNDMFRQLGLKNTFMAQPFAQKVTPVFVVTPGNAGAVLRPSLDPNAQSTVIDIGLLLESVDQCRKNAGSFSVVFGGKPSSAHCEQILSALGQNKAVGLLDLAQPNTSVIHRQSWDDYNHGDAAIVRSPGGDYVIVVMMSSDNKLDWSTTVPIINDIARATYGFFNNGQLPPPRTGGFAPPPQ
ncbi:MAG: class A beta-lactamase-related serine hydrolase [Anaerolineae bacterium]|nr:class A beta-lactamase-related serine hydrolase [Anaerolineae bacterium]